MKDIVIFESATARERREKRRQRLVSLHQSETPPPEFGQAPPRRLHWKGILKFIVALEVAVLVVVLIGAIHLISRTTSFWRQMDDDNQNVLAKFSRHAEQTNDPAEMRKAEKPDATTKNFGERSNSPKLS